MFQKPRPAVGLEQAQEVSFCRQCDRVDRLYVIGKGEVEMVREGPGAEEVVLVRIREGQFWRSTSPLPMRYRSPATVREKLRRHVAAQGERGH